MIPSNEVRLINGAEHVATLKTGINTEANARFIVKACNNHERLIETLQDVKDWMQSNDFYASDLYTDILEALANIEKEVQNEPR